MEFSASPIKIQNESGRWFMVVSQIDGGYLARDEVTSDLVYMKHSDIAGSEHEETVQ
ncbi:MAG: hypothetical protein PHY28_10480 [Dehalococcoidales bacterium]|nr:hypothetical protein [Dehalococcoidales bacterium]